MVDKQVVGGGKLTGPPANIFKTMDGLKWSEVVMTFITPEEVRIKARERNKTLTYAEMGFKNKQSRMAKPNLCWTALQGLAIITSTDKTLMGILPRKTDIKRLVSRLRKGLQEFFGIKDDPILYDANYKPSFTLVMEEHVFSHIRDRRAPDEKDEEGIETMMSQPPGR